MHKRYDVSVRSIPGTISSYFKKRAAEKKESETTKAVVVQVDDLLSFRQFSKKTADDAIDVCIPFDTRSNIKPDHLLV